MYVQQHVQRRKGGLAALTYLKKSDDLFAVKVSRWYCAVTLFPCEGMFRLSHASDRVLLPAVPTLPTILLYMVGGWADSYGTVLYVRKPRTYGSTLALPLLLHRWYGP